MIFVPDSNVIVSAHVFGGNPSFLLSESFARGHRIVTCDAIVAEVDEVLKRKHIIKALRKTRESIIPLKRFILHAEFVQPVPIPSTSRDPDDDVIIGCAVAARADIIVTGDNDLLTLGKYGRIEILSVADSVIRILTTK